MPAAAAPPAAAATQENLATPSSAVVLGQSGAAADAPVYTLASLAPTATRVLAWEAPSTDAVSTRMAANFASPSLDGRYAGLGAALLKRFSAGGADFSQSVLQSTLQSPPDASAAALNKVSQTLLHSAASNQIELDVQTADGVKVKLTLDSQDNGLAVQVKSSGKLSDAADSALARLAGAFQGAIDGISADPPTLDLGGLTQFDTTQLSSVDLHAQLQSGAQRIDFHADATQSSVNTDGPNGSIKVSVDLAHAASLGSATQRGEAMAAYLKQVDQAGSRGNADPAMLALFKDAYTQMNSTLPPQAVGTARAPTWSDSDHAMLTGLPDFSASLTEKTTSPNPMQPGEVDAFSYVTAQTTSVRGGAMDRAITQKQTAQLRASYHQPLSSDQRLKLDGTTLSQNYFYWQVSDDASSDAALGYDKGALASASLQQTASQSTHRSKYVMGELTEDSTTPLSASLSRDMLGVLQAATKQHKEQTPQQNAARQQLALAAVHQSILLQADPSRLRDEGGA